MQFGAGSFECGPLLGHGTGFTGIQLCLKNLEQIAQIAIDRGGFAVGGKAGCGPGIILPRGLFRGARPFNPTTSLPCLKRRAKTAVPSAHL